MWAATHQPSGVDVAVKVLTRLTERDPWVREAFRNEVRTAASLDHPAIIAVYDHGVVPDDAPALGPGSPYLVMERCGLTLKSELQGMEWPRLSAILITLLDALAHAHARGVVHRDLKPSNILVAEDSTLRLADFGLSQFVEREHSGAGILSSAGTPRYMPPEQVQGQWRKFGPWTDLYSLGVLGWRFSTGKAPFEGATWTATLAATLTDDLPRFEARFPVPDGLEEWLSQLLEKDPACRIACAADAARGLESLSDGSYRSRRGFLPVLAGLFGKTAKPERSAPPRNWRAGRRPPSTAPTGVGMSLFGLRAPRLVGRERERDLLWSALHDVHSTGRCRVVVVRGPSGRGKSRLARWLAERAHETGAGTILGAIHATGGGPETGLGAMIARHHRCRGLAREELIAHIAARLPATTIRPEDEARALATLVHARTAAVRFANPRERLLVIERLLQRIGSQRVAVVVLDDLQDGLEALALIELLCERQERSPCAVLVVATLDDDKHAYVANDALANLEDHTCFSTIRLAPLPTEVQEELGRTMGLNGTLARRVAERTHGNPLFAVQLVSDWVRRGQLVSQRRGFALASGGVALPDDLHAVWAARIAPLLHQRSRAEGEALELAAILGLQLDPTELEAVCVRLRLQPPKALLDDLLELGLLHPLPERSGLRFAHAMLRESFERRAELNGRAERCHLACAAHLEAMEDPSADQLERLARHLVLGGQPGQALPVLVRAAKRHARLGEHRRAALRLADLASATEAAQIPDGDPQLGSQMDLAVMRSLLERDGRAVEHATAFAEAVERHGWESWRAQALQRQAQAAHSAGELNVARDLVEQAEQLFLDSDDPLGAFRAALERADILCRLGDTELAWASGERAHRRAKALHDDYAHCRSHDVLAHAALAEGDHDRAEKHALRAQELAEEGGFRAIRELCTMMLGEIARFRGQLERAERLYRRAAEGLDVLGHFAGLFARVNLGFLLVEEGRFPEAALELRACSTSPDLHGWHPMRSPLALALACCCVLEDDWDLWDTHLAQAIEAQERSGFVDTDVAKMAEHAAGLARVAGQLERSRRAQAIALQQWESLGRREEAEAARSRLSE